jgi:hypothetical protein
LSLSGSESEQRNSLTQTSCVNGCTSLLLSTQLVKPLKYTLFRNVAVLSVRIWRQSRQILRHYESPAAPGARVLSLRRVSILKHRYRASCFVDGYLHQKKLNCFRINFRTKYSFQKYQLREYLNKFWTLVLMQITLRAMTSCSMKDTAIRYWRHRVYLEIPVRYLKNYVSHIPENGKWLNHRAGMPLSVYRILYKQTRPGIETRQGENIYVVSKCPYRLLAYPPSHSRATALISRG